MSRRRVLNSSLSLLLLSCGCQAMYFLMPEKGKPVKAEYTKIGSRKTAVLVWADRQTLDVDPKARRRVCEAISYDLKKHLEKADVVLPREVEELQEKSGLAWDTMSHADLFKHLKCDVLIRVDLLEYTTRGVGARELRKGQIRGTVNVYESGLGIGEDPSYHTEVLSMYPSEKDKRVTDLSDGELLRETVVQFGQAVGRKFYDHEVSYHGPEKR